MSTVYKSMCTYVRIYPTTLRHMFSNFRLTVDIVVHVEPAECPLKWRVCKLTGHWGDISLRALLCSLMIV